MPERFRLRALDYYNTYGDLTWPVGKECSFIDNWTWQLKSVCRKMHWLLPTRARTRVAKEWARKISGWHMKILHWESTWSVWTKYVTSGRSKHKQTFDMCFTCTLHLHGSISPTQYVANHARANHKAEAFDKAGLDHNNNVLGPTGRHVRKCRCANTFQKTCFELWLNFLITMCEIWSRNIVRSEGARLALDC